MTTKGRLFSTGYTVACSCGFEQVTGQTTTRKAGEWALGGGWVWYKPLGWICPTCWREKFENRLWPKEEMAIKASLRFVEAAPPPMADPDEFGG